MAATGYVGQPFSYTATATPPLTSFTASGLPPWASAAFDANNATLTISGIPTAQGISAVTLRPGNGAAAGASVLSITIFNQHASWAAAYFTTLELQNSAISGMSGDATGAGVKNLIKYALGIPPKQAGLVGLPTVGTIVIGANKYLTLTYTRNRLATGVTLLVQVNPTLATNSWVSSASFTTEVSRTDNGDGTETVVTRDNTAITANSRRFIRLLVRSP